jgi:WD40 repeat protein
MRASRGHTESINAVAIAKNGGLAVSASADQTLKVWDLETGRELRTFTGHSANVTSLALSADGRVAVSGSADQTLKVWDVESGQELRTLEGRSGSATCIALSADGRLAVSGSLTGILKAWDLESGQEVRSLMGHADSVRGVAIRADGSVAVSAGKRSLKVWALNLRVTSPELSPSDIKDVNLFAARLQGSDKMSRYLRSALCEKAESSFPFPPAQAFEFTSNDISI